MPPQGHPVFCASDNNLIVILNKESNQYSRAQPAIRNH